jgi:hypothetical protein
MADKNIFKSSAYLLCKNPILFVLPSIGSIISIISEAFYLVGLRNNTNNQSYFPFSDIFVLFLFFVSFTIAYFQLILILRKIIPKRGFENKNYYNIIIFELLAIYSFYALTLADIGNSRCRWFESLYDTVCNPKYNRSNIFAILFSMLIPIHDARLVV